MWIAALAAIAFFFPRATLEWVASMVIAFIAAYFTVANQYWYAPVEPFLGWYILDYAILQILFHLLNKRLDRQKITNPQPQGGEVPKDRAAAERQAFAENSSFRNPADKRWRVVEG
jgi:hypothetical protein